MRVHKLYYKRSVETFWFLYCLLWTDFIYRSVVFIVEFEQANICWAVCPLSHEIFVLFTKVGPNAVKKAGENEKLRAVEKLIVKAGKV